MPHTAHLSEGRILTLRTPNAANAADIASHLNNRAILAALKYPRAPTSEEVMEHLVPHLGNDKKPELTACHWIVYLSNDSQRHYLGCSNYFGVEHAADSFCEFDIALKTQSNLAAFHVYLEAILHTVRYIFSNPNIHNLRWSIAPNASETRMMLSSFGIESYLPAPTHAAGSPKQNAIYFRLGRKAYNRFEATGMMNEILNSPEPFREFRTMLKSGRLTKVWRP